MDRQKEHEILRVLERDARKTPAQIAVTIGENESEVESAIERLETAGVVRSYKTVVDWETAGVERVFAFIDLRVTPSQGVGFDEIARHICNHPEVHSVYLVSGDYDLRVVVEGASMREVAFFVAESLATMDGVLSTKSSFLLRKYKADGDVFFEETSDGRLAVTP